MSDTLVKGREATEDPDSRAAHFGSHTRWFAFGTLTAMALAAAVPPVAARRWSTEEFAQYNLAFRAVAVLQPALCVGLTVGLPRALAGRWSREETRTSGQVVAGALCISVGALLAAGGLLLGASSLTADLVFGDSRDTALVPALMGLLWGVSLAAVATALLRSRFLMKHASVVLVVTLGVVPLVAVGFASSPGLAILLIGGSSTAVAAVVFVRYGNVRWGLGVGSAVVRLIRYGVRRIPGELSLFGLFSLPPLLVARDGRLEDAGFLAVGMSLVVFAGGLFSPLSDVMLPHVRSDLDLGATDRVSSRVTRVAVISFVASCVLSLLCVVMAGPLVEFYLGAPYAAAAGIIRTVAFAIIPYGIYVAIRGALDAAHDQPRTMLLATLAMGIFVLSYAAFAAVGMKDPAAVAFVVALWGLGLGVSVDAVRLVHRLDRKRVQPPAWSHG